eukprot:TRINITY_DN8180_c0_g1_i11.p1 TRINITY_DN8180_c0_g1~~TRINITY_DN8180_c0_g1_i11.p1  ORF type:complete len:985 (-),score=197.54 TRINITY_DN8180_c0_g1_i11:50-2959(-)
MDYRNLSDVKRKELQKKGNQILKELVVIFPDQESRVIADAIKRCGFNKQATLDLLLSTLPPRQVNEGSSSQDTKKFLQPAKRIREILPSVTIEEIISLLQQNHGDEEKVTLLLLESNTEEVEPQPQESIKEEVTQDARKNLQNEQLCYPCYNEFEISIPDYDMEDIDMPSSGPSTVKKEETVHMSELLNRIREDLVQRDAALRIVSNTDETSSSDMTNFSGKGKGKNKSRDVKDSSRKAIRLSTAPSTFPTVTTNGEVPDNVQQFLNRVYDKEINNLVEKKNTTVIISNVPQMVTPLTLFTQLRKKQEEFSMKICQKEMGAVQSPNMTTSAQEDFEEETIDPALSNDWLSVGKGIPIKPVLSYLRLQEIELDKLRSFFGVQMRESHFYPKRLSLKINSKVDFMEDLLLVMDVTLHPNYPDVEPLVRIRSDALGPSLSRRVLAQVTCFVNRKAVEFQGRNCIWELLDVTRKWLESSLVVEKESLKLRDFQVRDCFSFGNVLRSITAGGFESFTRESLLRDYDNLILSVADQLSPMLTNDVILLLHYFKWDKRILLKEYNCHTQNKILDELFSKAGILTQAATSEAWKEKLEWISCGKIECSGCLEDYTIEKMATLPCSHIYCIDCLRTYTELQIAEGGGHSIIKCPGYSCMNLMDYTMVCWLLREEDRIKYLLFTLNDYVEHQPHLKWCPSKNCDRVVQKSHPRGMVLCGCGCLWCWQCKDEGHWPATCEQHKWWLETFAKDEKHMQQVSQEEALSVRWLLDYTQDCPKCSSPIEKSGGCNHMSCKKCGYQYCWICKETWNPSHYSCKNLVEVPQQDRDHIASQMESNLSFVQLYLINMNNRAQTDTQVKNKILKLIETLSSSVNTSTEELQNLFNILELLYLCRHFSLKLCVQGKYMQEHSIGGSTPLKNDIRWLTSNISYASSQVHTFSSKQYKSAEVMLILKGLESTLYTFVRSYTKFLKSPSLGKK